MQMSSSFASNHWHFPGFSRGVLRKAMRWWCN